MEERQRMAQWVLEVALSGQDAITLSITPSVAGLDFDWGGPQSDYDRVERACNDAGYSFADIQADVESLVIKREVDRRRRLELVQGMTAEDFQARVFNGGTPTIDVTDGQAVVSWDFTPEAATLLQMYAEREGTDLETLLDDINRQVLVKRGLLKEGS